MPHSPTPWIYYRSPDRPGGDGYIASKIDGSQVIWNVDEIGKENVDFLLLAVNTFEEARGTFEYLKKRISLLDYIDDLAREALLSEIDIVLAKMDRGADQ